MLREMLAVVVLGIAEDIVGNAGSDGVSAGQVEQQQAGVRSRGNLERDAVGIGLGVEQAVGDKVEAIPHDCFVQRGAEVLCKVEQGERRIFADRTGLGTEAAGPRRRAERGVPVRASGYAPVARHRQGPQECAVLLEQRGTLLAGERGKIRRPQRWSPRSRLSFARTRSARTSSVVPVAAAARRRSMGRGSESPWKRSPARKAHADLWSIELRDVAVGLGNRVSTSGIPGTTSDSRELLLRNAQRTFEHGETNELVVTPRVE